MAKAATDYSLKVGQAHGRQSPLRPLLTAFSATLSGFFFGVCWVFYWTMAVPGAITAFVIPRRWLERRTLVWLVLASLGVAASTRTINTLIPDFTQPSVLLGQVTVWFALGFFSRVYLVYSELPNTFEGMKESIASRRIESWFASVLPNAIDAIIVRIWLANAIGLLPATVMLVCPSTFNYFAVVAYSGILLLIQFPMELADHTNTHSRIFNPKPGVSLAAKRTLTLARIYFEYVLCLMAGRIPDHYRIQHVYNHHVEHNGPDDTQSTMHYDRASFLDFSRHSFWQGLELMTGYGTHAYLRNKGKERQMREFMRGMVIYYAVLLATALVNPLAALVIFVSRFLGGNIQALIGIAQHGLIDPKNIYDVHGNCTDFDHCEHGVLAFDFHVEHHLKPARHWSQLRGTFDQTSAAASGHPAMVFNKEMFGQLSMICALWTRDYAKVASFAKVAKSDEDAAKVAEIVHARTRPIGDHERTGVFAKIDAVAGRVAAWAVSSSFRRWDDHGQTA